VAIDTTEDTMTYRIEKDLLGEKQRIREDFAGEVGLNKIARFRLDRRDRRDDQDYFELIGDDDGFFGCIWSRFSGERWDGNNLRFRALTPPQVRKRRLT
jgi:hypothetical protein